MLHDRRRLEQILAWLDANAITAWLFGGWAEEMRGLCIPRLHTDVDLLLSAESFEELDEVIRRLALTEIELKRAAHKRAIVLAGVMIEFFLVQHDARGPYTDFWGAVRFRWPGDLWGQTAGSRIASESALHAYRASHSQLHAGRPADATTGCLGAALRHGTSETSGSAG